TTAELRPVFDAVMRRMVAEVGDDHSRWIGLRDIDAVVGAQAVDQVAVEPVDRTPTPDDESADQPTGGNESTTDDPTVSMGFGLQVRYLSGVGLVVERVLPQTPASEAGMRRGDVIERIDDSDLRTLGAGAADAGGRGGEARGGRRREGR